jgi:hypothetical protein
MLLLMLLEAPALLLPLLVAVSATATAVGFFDQLNFMFFTFFSTLLPFFSQ